MKKLILSSLIPVLLGGCAGFGAPPPVAGERIDAVRARLGQPTSTIPDGGDTLLEYATGPFGQRTYMARFGSDGALRSYEQVLTDAKFGTIKVGADRIEKVVSTVGHPTEKSYLPLRELHVWSYRYKQSDVWDAMMHVHFDKNGIVRDMMAGPDPDREEKRSFFR
ncbi:hypothetical protein [Pseudoduganella namucuonensis]|uniref:Outer membrane protein assembly factor BamE n=1 Tax=Pseudoduganella namucuonensis TaxID=1035707 RepID=A0A1I7JPM7_9BURK|nr:hypothetical protein [Pseudoduganella namucuonensis]SFU87129.1 hypothetical protein SAMN05216552_1012127 [Pseudoduganella namucuonensis]